MPVDHRTPSLLLGHKISSPKVYSPDILYPIARALGRQHMGLQEAMPCWGVDIWNAYELCWLDMYGYPQHGIATCHIAADSVYLVESKSFKLYLHGLNACRFETIEHVAKVITQDLQRVVCGDVRVVIDNIKHSHATIEDFSGICIDDTPKHTPVITKTRREDFLVLDAMQPVVTESLYSHALQSNCPVTSQPDWGSVLISYTGHKIDHLNLLHYILSYHDHDAFHEQCVEHIFIDIQRYLKPDKLTVYARYTRRGGLDINPFRSNFESQPNNARHIRQ